MEIRESKTQKKKLTNNNKGKPQQKRRLVTVSHKLQKVWMGNGQQSNANCSSVKLRKSWRQFEMVLLSSKKM